MSLSPLVILIDLDGTIQGDVNNQVQEYIFLDKLTKKLHGGNVILKQNKMDVMYDMEQKLLRPYFKSFMMMMKKHFEEDIELFVYTASEKKWANYIIPIIESLIGLKFNRPIFTRSDCIWNNTQNKYFKSIDSIHKKISRCLQTKYSKLNKNLTLKYNDMYLIDNNYTLIHGEEHKLILCPTYDYSVFCSPLRNIPSIVMNKYFKIIGDEILHQIITNVWELNKLWFEKAYKKNAIIENRNKMYIKDDYWKKVCIELMTCKRKKLRQDEFKECIINNLKKIFKG